MHNIQLLIFDMDGVIVDSEPLHRAAKQKILACYEIDKIPDLDKTIGLPNEEFWEWIIRDNGLLTTPEKLVMLQNDLILDMMHRRRVGPTNGLIHLFNELQERNIKTGLASSSIRYFVEKVLNMLNISDRITYTVTGDEVVTKKPAPDCYLKVLELAGTKPSEALAIEDSTAGVAAACAAKIKCFGFLNPGSGKQDLSKSFRTIGSLLDIIPYLDEC